MLAALPPVWARPYAAIVPRLGGTLPEGRGLTDSRIVRVRERVRLGLTPEGGLRRCESHELGS